LQEKTRVVVVAEEDVPDTLVPVLPAFIATARAVSEGSDEVSADAEYYVERLFTLLLQDRERLILATPMEMRSELRDVALKVIAATAPSPSMGAAVILKLVGRPEDAAFLEAHCPAEPVLAKVFLDAAKALHGLRKN
jgi:hypothetical protein